MNKENTLCILDILNILKKLKIINEAMHRETRVRAILREQ
jgi:hypothetical protein